MTDDFVGTEGLILVSGFSFEKIKEKLDEKTIEYLISHEPHRWMKGYESAAYFRQSSIFAPDRELSNITGLFGIGKSMEKIIFYYGAYKLTPGFDLTSLDGLLRFKEGHLIERIGVIKLRDDAFDKRVENYLEQLRNEAQNPGNNQVKADS